LRASSSVEDDINGSVLVKRSPVSCIQLAMPPVVSGKRERERERERESLDKFSRNNGARSRINDPPVRIVASGGA